MSKKIKTICVDTLNGIQNNQYMSMIKKPNYDQWFDFGKDVYGFILDLQKLGFEIILINGFEGTGKSYGMKYLEPETNIWYNADAKNPTWKENGKDLYGTKKNPSKFQVIPETYDEIKDHIKAIIGAGALVDNPVAFLTSHIEEYKGADGMRQRMKTLGRIATKMNVEGKMEQVYYTKLERKDGKLNYWFLTRNTGSNTGRSPEGMFDSEKIPNNYQLILDGTNNY